MLFDYWRNAWRTCASPYVLFASKINDNWLYNLYNKYNVLFFKIKLTGKDGPIHDAQWSYSGLEFAVVYGCILFSVVFTILW